MKGSTNACLVGLLRSISHPELLRLQSAPPTYHVSSGSHRYHSVWVVLFDNAAAALNTAWMLSPPFVQESFRVE